MPIKDLMIRFENDGKSFWVAFKLLGADWIDRCFVREFKAAELANLVAGWQTWDKLPPAEAARFEEMLEKFKKGDKS